MYVYTYINIYLSIEVIVYKYQYRTSYNAIKPKNHERKKKSHGLKNIPLFSQISVKNCKLQNMAQREIPYLKKDAIKENEKRPGQILAAK